MIVILTFCCFIYQVMSVSDMSQEIVAAESKIAKLNRRIIDLSSGDFNADERDEYLSRLNKINDVRKGKVQSLKLMDMVQNRIPDNAYLEWFRCEYNRNVCEMEMQVAKYEDLNKMINTLNGDGLGSSLNIVKRTKDTRTNNELVLLRMGAK